MTLFRRFWVYQAERFPLLANGLLVAVITAGSLGYSLVGRGAERWPPIWVWLAAFSVALGFFFQLRVADEYKDYADDAQYRAYRPVPRGLIRLRELAGIAVAGALLQLALTAWLRPALGLFLLAVWVYMWLMRLEFFVPNWLKAHPIAYMLSHMVILPLIFLYITACDWFVKGGPPPPGLGWYLGAAFSNGVVYEVGRKIRAPESEEEGVETYSRLWGRGPAVMVWSGAMGIAGVCAIAAARFVGLFGPAVVLIVILLAVVIAISARYVRKPGHANAHRIELFSALWMLALYGLLGIVPLLLQLSALFRGVVPKKM